jgi:hypothetical protein
LVTGEAETQPFEEALKNALLYADDVKWLHIEEREHPSRALERVGNAERRLTDAGLLKVCRCEFVTYLGSFSHASTALDHLPEVPAEIWDNVRPLGAAGLHGIRDMVKSVRVFVNTGRGEPSPKTWSTYEAVSALLSENTNLLLPDISSLPFEAVAEIRDRLKDNLDPMRAEMLRLTEDLRKMVGRKLSEPGMVRAEARNLIATRVEPVVREASSRAREMANNKWRKLYTGAAKALGFAGAGYLDPKLLAKAVQQTLEVGALAFAKPEDKTPGPKATANFVLEAYIVADRFPRS